MTSGAGEGGPGHLLVPTHMDSPCRALWNKHPVLV